MQEILSVTELTAAIKKQLESRFLSVSVKGEVSNFKEQSSGHLYFTLKDAGAQISCVLFRGNAMGLARKPKDGDQLVLKGELSVYAPRGNYQLIVRELSHVGVGELLLKLHELKLKLQQLGWFDPKHKKKLPKFPQVIGVVTSPTGAVIQDILTVLNRRFSNFRLLLNPVKVQGEGAALEIAQAIEQFNQHGLADVLIVGRGGGSLEDLWAFNEEIVAKAIFSSRIPIISAVGHETDFSIADFVADVRAPTPSAAAEMVIFEKEKELQFLSQMRRRMQERTSLILKDRRERLRLLKRQPALTQPLFLIGKFAQMLDDAKDSLLHTLEKKVQEKRLKFAALQRAVQTQTPQARVKQLREKLSFTAAHLKAINPKNLLTKGYAILFDEKTGAAILKGQHLKKDERVRILMQDGSVRAKIEEAPKDARTFTDKKRTKTDLNGQGANGQKSLELFS